MNKNLNLPELQKIMMEFEKQSDAMDLKEEMMEDTMDDVMGEEVLIFPLITKRGFLTSLCLGR